MYALIWLIILLCTASVSSKSDKRLFALAQKSMLHQEIDQARERYSEIKNKDAAVWYNLGNIAFAEKKYPEARLYWLRARKDGDAPLFKHAYQNLVQLDTAIYQQETSVTDNVWYWLMLVNKYVSIFLLQLLFLFAWMLLLRSAFLGIRRTGSLSTAFVLLFFLLGPLWAAYRNQRAKVVVIAEPAALYNGPSKLLYEVGSFRAGMVADLLEQQKHWYKIVHADKRGWVQADRVVVV